MKLSVTIPTYNEEKYIEQCLKALSQQTVAADEIIVVDNNCQDQTIALAKKFKVKIVTEIQQGIVYARNTGFNAARFELIARVDADTIVPIDWVEKLKRSFKDRSIDALTGTMIFYDLPLKTTFWNNLYLDFIKVIQKNKGTLIGFNMAIRKKMWNKVKDKVCLNERNVHEDADLGLWVGKLGGKIKHDKTLVVETSARRILKKPWSFFGEYPLRFISTLLLKRD